MNNLSAATAPPQSTSTSRDGRQSEDGWPWTNDSSSSMRNANALRETTKSIFIKRLELTINGTPIDQVNYFIKGLNFKCLKFKQCQPNFQN